MLRQYELVERVLAYDPDADEALLNRAYVYTVQKHGTQKRASGDPYFSHPIEVARVSSTVSWSIAVTIVSWSSFKSVISPATSIGWLK